jgi:hypothetical protein
MVDSESLSCVKEGPMHYVVLITFRNSAMKERERYSGMLERWRWWSVLPASRSTVFISTSSFPADDHRDHYHASSHYSQKARRSMMYSQRELKLRSAL